MKFQAQPATQRSRLLGLCAILLLLFPPLEVRAEAGRDRQLSDYERESLRIALEQIQGQLEPAAEGKLVEAIEIVPLDVIEPRDPLPLFLNVFHVTTDREVIAREVLLRVGRPFSRDKATRTEQNLRGYASLSVVLVTAVRGSAPDRVRVLVVTKDVWSLRMSWAPSFVNGKLTSLSLQPSEINLFGTAQAVFLTVDVGVDQYAVGAGFSIPRLAGSRIAMTARANARFSCTTGEVQGSSGALIAGEPLYDTSTQWSWGTSLSWSEGLVRAPDERRGSLCSGDVLPRFAIIPGEGEEADRVIGYPEAYFSNGIAGTGSVTRSFYRLDKLDLSFGVEAARAWAYPDDVAIEEVRYFALRDDNRLGDPIPAPDDPAQRRAEFDAVLEQRLPTSTQRISPFFLLQAYSSRLQPMINYVTLGLQETYRVGHSVGLKLYPALKALGSNRNLFGVDASASYGWPIGTGRLSLSAANSIELSRIDQTQAEAAVAGIFTTPWLGFGRFVYAAHFSHRYKNFLNSQTSLGGTGRLRGFIPRFFIGPHWVLSNLEYRSRPLRLFNVLFGAAAFYDVGDAFASTGSIDLKHGGGFGLRVLAPQLDRNVFRVDFGFPLSRHEGGEFTWLARFGQAF